MCEITSFEQKIDLHVHSCASDGTFRPAEIARMAGEKELKAIALTDHDTVAGVREFMTAGKDYPDTEFIPGVELSSIYGSKELHFVGLYVDIENQQFTDFLEKMREGRLRRNINIAKKLASLGYPVDTAEVDYLNNDSIGRLHFAAYLVKHYEFESIQEVFERYLRRNGSAYVPRELPMPSDAIAMIRQANGIAVWAHPLYRDQKNAASFLRRMTGKLKSYGLNGLECYYSMFGPAETNMLLNAAEQQELLVSGGSDFHGANRPGIELGTGGGKMSVPVGVIEKMHEFVKNASEVDNA